jgi:hypothetical protein
MSSLLTVFAVCKVHRTHNNEVDAAQSPVLSNNNEVPSKKVYISKPPCLNKKGIGCKKKKSSSNYKAEWDTLALPDRAHHIQVYSAAVA